MCRWVLLGSCGLNLSRATITLSWQAHVLRQRYWWRWAAVFAIEPRVVWRLLELHGLLLDWLLLLLTGGKNADGAGGLRGLRRVGKEARAVEVTEGRAVGAVVWLRRLNWRWRVSRVFFLNRLVIRWLALRAAAHLTLILTSGTCHIDILKIFSFYISKWTTFAARDVVLVEVHFLGRVELDGRLVLQWLVRVVRSVVATHFPDRAIVAVVAGVTVQVLQSRSRARSRMGNWQDIVRIFLQLLPSVLIHHAHNAHDHWQDYKQNDKDNDPYDVTREEDLAYKLLRKSLFQSCSWHDDWSFWKIKSFFKGRWG